jgi:DNA-binding NarL/FixJ family response regulator
LDEVKYRLQRFDVIILDADLLDIYRIDLAREILHLIPARKLVITTAFDDHALTREAESIGISKEKVLLKPFRLSKLWSAAMDN